MKTILGPGATLRGYIKEDTTQKVLLAPGGRVLGRYIKSSDITLNSTGRLYGYGDQLMSLLED